MAEVYQYTLPDGMVLEASSEEELDRLIDQWEKENIKSKLNESLNKQSKSLQGKGLRSFSDMLTAKDAASVATAAGMGGLAGGIPGAVIGGGMQLMANTVSEPQWADSAANIVGGGVGYGLSKAGPLVANTDRTGTILPRLREGLKGGLRGMAEAGSSDITARLVDKVNGGNNYGGSFEGSLLLGGGLGALSGAASVDTFNPTIGREKAKDLDALYKKKAGARMGLLKTGQDIERIDSELATRQGEFSAFKEDQILPITKQINELENTKKMIELEMSKISGNIIPDEQVKYKAEQLMNMYDEADKELGRLRNEMADNVKLRDEDSGEYEKVLKQMDEYTKGLEGITESRLGTPKGKLRSVNKRLEEVDKDLARLETTNKMADVLPTKIERNRLANFDINEYSDVILAKHGEEAADNIFSNLRARQAQLPPYDDPKAEDAYNAFAGLVQVGIGGDAYNNILGKGQAVKLGNKELGEIARLKEERVGLINQQKQYNDEINRITEDYRSGRINPQIKAKMEMLENNLNLTKTREKEIKNRIDKYNKLIGEHEENIGKYDEQLKTSDKEARELTTLQNEYRDSLMKLNPPLKEIMDKISTSQAEINKIKALPVPEQEALFKQKAGLKEDYMKQVEAEQELDNTIDDVMNSIKDEKVRKQLGDLINANASGAFRTLAVVTGSTIPLKAVLLAELANKLEDPNVRARIHQGLSYAGRLFGLKGKLESIIPPGVLFMDKQREVQE